MITIISLLIITSICYAVPAYLNAKAQYMKPRYVIASLLCWIPTLILADHKTFITVIMSVIMIYIINIIHIGMRHYRIAPNDERHKEYMSLSMYINFMFVIHQIFIVVHLFLNM